MIYSEKDYVPACPRLKQAWAAERGEWTSQFPKKNAFSMEISLTSDSTVNESVSLVLGVGIQFGRHITESVIEPVKYAGCAMILGVG